MIALVVAAAALAQQAWPIGVEREVDEGVYMSVVAAEQGWRVWKIETATGTDCRAYKSAQGRRHPVPAGYRSMMAREGTPFLEIRWNEGLGRYYAEWNTVNYVGSTKYRVPSERFWTEGDPDPATVTGTGWALQRVRECREDLGVKGTPE